MCHASFAHHKLDWKVVLIDDALSTQIAAPRSLATEANRDPIEACQEVVVETAAVAKKKKKK